MEKSFGLFFHLKTTKNYKGIGELPIYLCVTVDKVSREISTKRKWDPAKWNSDSGRAEGKTENVRSLNSYLDLLQRKVYEGPAAIVTSWPSGNCRECQNRFFWKGDQDA